MHIITGLIFAALAGAKKNGKNGKRVRVPRFTTGPVQTVHALPGRLRLRVPSLVDDEAGQKTLGERFPTLPGVESIRITPVSGSVLIHYDETEVEPDLLFAAVVSLLNLEAEMDKPVQPLITRELKAAGQSLNRCVFEKTGGVVDLWSAVMILLAGVGVRKMVQDPARAFPAGFTLLWWGLTTIRRQE